MIDKAKTVLQMSPAKAVGGCWPTEGQRLLLQAALLDATDAIPAWEKWQGVERLDALDLASWRMLPLVYLNLTRCGVNDPLLVETKLIHRHYWAHNRQLFHQSASFLDELKALEVPVLILKGAALSQVYYQDAGARPMGDFDVLVPRDRLMSVAHHLLRQGWDEYGFELIEMFDLDTMPSRALERGDGFQVDLHGHVLHADCRADADLPFWEHAQPMEWQGRSVLTLCPEDHLVHAICHGLRWCEVPPFRWMADVWKILQVTGDRFDWDRFIEQSRYHRVQSLIEKGLVGMQEIVPVPVPDGVLPALRAIPSSLAVRIEFTSQLQEQPLTFISWVRVVRQEWYDPASPRALKARFDGLLSYLMAVVQVRHVLLLPLGVASWLIHNRWRWLKLFAARHPPLDRLTRALQTVLFYARKTVFRRARSGT